MKNKLNIPNLAPQNLAGKAVLLLGAGYSALAMAKYLKHFGAQIQVVDSRENPPNFSEFQKLNLEIKKIDFDNLDVSSEKFCVKVFDEIEFIAISPGIPLVSAFVQKAIAANIAIVGEMELFGLAITTLSPQAKLIGITGSNGKTTVTTLVGLMLAKCKISCIVAGNIKPSALEQLLNIIISKSDFPTVWVLELSSFQLASTYQTKFYVGVILNISENHLDWHPDFQDYILSKQKIYQLSQKKLVNNDDAEVIKLATNVGCIDYKAFSIKNPADCFIEQASGKIILAGSAIGNRAESKLLGSHNSANIVAALAIVGMVGGGLSSAILALSEFSGIRHRTQLVAKINQVEYINDSKSTTVAATNAAIVGLPQGLNKKIILIVGGLGKNQDFSQLAIPIYNSVKKLILIGRDARLIFNFITDFLRKQNKTLEIVIDFPDSFNQAMQSATSSCYSGDAILFSPACASFDMFANYEARGDEFCNWVLTYQKAINKNSNEKIEGLEHEL